jgi:hypothetical protein
MTEEKYEDKIKGMLTKVSKGETVFKVEPEDKTLKKIKEKGVKTAILDVFNESETPSFTKVEENEEGNQYVTVDPPSSYADCDEYWGKIKPYLQRLGAVNPNTEKSGVMDISVDGKPIKVRLVRDTKNGEKPSIMFEGDIEHNKIIEMVEKCGLKVPRLECKTYGKNLILEILA